MPQSYQYVSSVDCCQAPAAQLKEHCHHLTDCVCKKAWDSAAREDTVSESVRDVFVTTTVHVCLPLTAYYPAIVISCEAVTL